MYFSIIIPTLNEEKFLPHLLESLAKQKSGDFEIVIVDAKSEDQTVKKAQIFKTRFKKLTILTSKEKNVSVQRNLGAVKAKGKFLVFLDADGQVSPDFLAILRQKIRQVPGLIYLPKFVPDIKTPDTQLMFELAYFFVEISQYTPRPFSCGGNLIIEPGLFRFLGGFNKNLPVSEDHDLIQRAKQLGVSARLLPDVKVIFSLRRMRQEGRLKYFSKFLYLVSQTALAGKLKPIPIEYEMGGQLYSVDKKSTRNFNWLIRANLAKFKALINRHRDI